MFLYISLVSLVLSSGKNQVFGKNLLTLSGKIRLAQLRVPKNVRLLHTSREPIYRENQHLRLRMP